MKLQVSLNNPWGFTGADEVEAKFFRDLSATLGRACEGWPPETGITPKDGELLDVRIEHDKLVVRILSRRTFRYPKRVYDDLGYSIDWIFGKIAGELMRQLAA